MAKTIWSFGHSECNFCDILFSFFLYNKVHPIWVYLLKNFSLGIRYGGMVTGITLYSTIETNASVLVRGMESCE